MAKRRKDSGGALVVFRPCCAGLTDFDLNVKLSGEMGFKEGLTQAQITVSLPAPNSEGCALDYCPKCGLPITTCVIPPGTGIAMEGIK